MSLTLAFTVIALAVAAWTALFVVIPHAIASMLRLRLWRVRDNTMDDILTGQLHNVAQARRFIAEVEGAIRIAPDLSLLNLFVVNRLTRRHQVRFRAIELNQLRRSDRDKMTPRVNRLHYQVVRHAFVGSPFGWIALVLLLAVATVRVFARRLVNVFMSRSGPKTSFKAETRKRVTTEVSREFDDVEPALAAMVQRRPDHDAAKALV